MPAGSDLRAPAMYGAMAGLESGKFVQKVKYGCELLGVPMGEMRRPLLPLPAAEEGAFEAASDGLNRTPLAA